MKKSGPSRGRARRGECAPGSCGGESRPAGEWSPAPRGAEGASPARASLGRADRTGGQAGRAASPTADEPYRAPRAGSRRPPPPPPRLGGLARPGPAGAPRGGPARAGSDRGAGPGLGSAGARRGLWRPPLCRPRPATPPAARRFNPGPAAPTTRDDRDVDVNEARDRVPSTRAPAPGPRSGAPRLRA